MPAGTAYFDRHGDTFLQKIHTEAGIGKLGNRQVLSKASGFEKEGCLF